MSLVNTTRGEMDESLLERREGGLDDDNETTEWVEYWFEEELVHRSVSVVLKPVAAESAAQSF